MGSWRGLKFPSLPSLPLGSSEVCSLTKFLAVVFCVFFFSSEGGKGKGKKQNLKTTHTKLLSTNFLWTQASEQREQELKELPGLWVEVDPRAEASSALGSQGGISIKRSATLCTRPLPCS